MECALDVFALNLQNNAETRSNVSALFSLKIFTQRDCTTKKSTGETWPSMKTSDHLWFKFISAAALAALLLGTVWDPSVTNRTPIQTRVDAVTSAPVGPWSIEGVDFVSVDDGWVAASNPQGLGALFVTQDGGDIGHCATRGPRPAP